MPSASCSACKREHTLHWVTDLLAVNRSQISTSPPEDVGLIPAPELLRVKPEPGSRPCAPAAPPSSFRAYLAPTLAFTDFYRCLFPSPLFLLHRKNASEFSL